MNSGIAKQIRERWPRVYDEYCDWCDSCNDMLGHIQIVHIDNGPSVINLAAQLFYGYDGRRYTSYDAFWACLGKIKEQVPKGSKIGFPYKIGCGLGGANWQVIFQMIMEVLEEDYQVYIYTLEE
jgi:O-acetyl-ADP-ribose deacetylase (regulator of RNase III)